jgi:peroxidase
LIYNSFLENAGATMASSTTTYDNVYCKLLLQGKIIFSSDQALLISTRETKALVSKFAGSQEMFEKAFVGETTIHQNIVL